MTDDELVARATQLAGYSTTGPATTAALHGLLARVEELTAERNHGDRLVLALSAAHDDQESACDDWLELRRQLDDARAVIAAVQKRAEAEGRVDRWSDFSIGYDEAWNDVRRILDGADVPGGEWFVPEGESDAVRMGSGPEPDWATFAKWARAGTYVAERMVVVERRERTIGGEA